MTAESTCVSQQVLRRSESEKYNRKNFKAICFDCFRPRSLSMFCLQKRNRNGLWKNLRIINQGRKFLSGIWSFHVVHLSSIPCFKKYKYLKRVTNVERIPLKLKFWWTYTSENLIRKMYFLSYKDQTPGDKLSLTC